MTAKKKSSSILKNKNILDDQDFLSKLIVGIGEVSEITGIAQRQLRYWEQKGIITTQKTRSTNRRFNYLEIKKIILIKELVDEGYTLEIAAKKVENRMELINSTFEKLKAQL